MTGDTGATAILSSKHRTVKLDGIQIVRALAASLVVADHALLTIGSKEKEFAWLMGAVGVWLFFIVSGVIMHHTTRDDPRNFQVAKLFIARRLVRIVPLYWIFTFALIAQALFRAREMRAEWIIKSLFFIPYLDDKGEIHPIVQQGWTLNYEIVFYLVFTASLLISRRAGTLVVFATLGALAGLSLAPLSMPWSAWTDPVVILFGVGIIVSILRSKVNFDPRIRSSLPLLVLTGTLLTVFLLWKIPSYPPSFLYHCIAWLSCAAIVMMATNILSSRGYIARFIESLGDASYSTYLCHNIIIYPIFKMIGHKLSWGLTVTIMVIGANFAGLLIFHMIEKPLNKQLRRVVSKL